MIGAPALRRNHTSPTLHHSLGLCNG